MNINLDDIEILTEDNKILMKLIRDYGECTVWQLYKDYGIDRQKTRKAIREKKLRGFMKKVKDKKGEILIPIKYYIVKDERLENFIKKNRIS